MAWSLVNFMEGLYLEGDVPIFVVSTGEVLS